MVFLDFEVDCLILRMEICFILYGFSRQQPDELVKASATIYQEFTKQQETQTQNHKL